jgi:putative transposase
MPNYRRWRQDGGCFFLTVVTYGRAPFLTGELARGFLHDALADVHTHRPWHTEAIVRLPDHWHALWRMPAGDTDYSGRIAQVKKQFTDAWLAAGGQEQEVTPAQAKARRRGVWQRKFWEHTIRDARDFKMHLDYIHANPVKHGLVGSPKDWPWSSFSQWVKAGEYDVDWCGRIDLPGNVEYFDWDG